MAMEAVSEITKIEVLNRKDLSPLFAAILFPIINTSLIFINLF